MKLRVGVTCKVEVHALDYHGLGIANNNNRTILIRNMYPGETGEVLITGKKSRKYLAKILKREKISDLRGKSNCPHFPECGGCQIMDIDYPQQLELKQTILNNLKKELLADLDFQIQKILPCSQTEFYRNKMEFAFYKEGSLIYAGLKKRGSFSEIINTRYCRLQSETTQKILNFCSDYFSQNNWTVWGLETQVGLLRYLVIRQSKTQHNFMLNLIISDYQQDYFQDFTKKITSEIPEIATVLVSVNNTKSETAFTTETFTLYGTGYLQEIFKKNPESLEKIIFQISPVSFFQTNTFQAELLYQKIVEIAELTKVDHLLDLYCGTGTIGMFLAANAGSVTGIEENTAAVADANLNAQENNINNIKFIAGRVKNILKFNKLNAECIIIDPPRSGMVPKALKRMLEQEPQKIIYVSCNPFTLMQDLKQICEAGYKIEVFQPVDMYPNTFHMEVITRLVKYPD